VKRSDGLKSAIAVNEQALTVPSRRDAALMRLAYLYHASGRLGESDALWSALDSCRTPVTMADQLLKSVLGR
jgi:hypothetical protein